MTTKSSIQRHVFPVIGLAIMAFMYSGPAQTAETRSKVDVVNVQQYSQQMAEGFMKQRQEPFVHELPPAMQQQMQQSLQHYMEGWLCRLLGCGSNNDDDEAGTCFPAQAEMCPPDDVMQVREKCFGRPRSQCTKGLVLCTNTQTGTTRQVKPRCEWVSSKPK